METGFIKVAAANINTVVADTSHNLSEILNTIDLAESSNVKLLAFPELCVTGYTCGDLFLWDKLISSAKTTAESIINYTVSKDVIIIFGVPLSYCGKLYNCSVIASNGKALGVAVKTFLSDTDGLEESRYFSSAETLEKDAVIEINGTSVPFGNNLIFAHSELDFYTFAAEVGKDLYSTQTVGSSLCSAGAAIILNTAACAETAFSNQQRITLVNSVSEKQLCGYVFSSAGCGESTQDTVFSAHRIISELGFTLSEAKPFEASVLTVSEIDAQKIFAERRKNRNFTACKSFCRKIVFNQAVEDTKLTRKTEKNPFLPSYCNIPQTCESILNIQAYALRKRITHTGAKKMVLGISGGLDSTLSLLVCVRTADLLKKDRKDILCVTMPCFGTTARTKSNAEKLCEALGTSFKEVNIADSVKQHLKDIGHSEYDFDAAYENAQARERTQVLMDIANMNNGIVIGTGDLSELALGWATYNGDHMSMYATNSGIPKTVIRYSVAYEAERLGNKIREILADILDTPVSPELLPPDDNKISQKTEDIVGPYELHDFFLYYTVRNGFSPKKIYILALNAFKDEYSNETIAKWLKIFVRRFFSQQFKRSCMPDGPKVFSFSLSPRGDFKMPTDASNKLWAAEAETFEL